MNSIIKEYYPIFEMYQALRRQLMEMITDEELSFTPGGENLTLGTLCREIGEIQYAYIESFKTFRLDFSYRNEEPGLESSVDRLAAWFNALDEQLKETIAALSEEEIEIKTIDRGSWTLPVRIQLNVYQEALLIFYGKTAVYLKAMEKPRPKQWQDWIG